MSTFEVLFLFLFLLPIVQATGPCPLSMCGSNSVPIRFPFKLLDQLGQHCGYPGFDLSCNSDRNTVLKLPYSGEFFVRKIDYSMQQIQLYDPDNCLPRRLLHLNLSGSPFASAVSQEYTFLSCPTQFTIKSRFSTIDCLSNSTVSVIATSSPSLADSVSPPCKIISTLPIPVQRPFQYDEGSSADFNLDLPLAWYEPDCVDCETQGGFCGFRSNTSEAIGCFFVPKAGLQHNGLRVFRIICFSIALPAVTCFVAISCFAFLSDRARGSSTRRSNTLTGVVSPQPSIFMVGLDESTIQSYEKVVLGESRRLPGPNGISCPICLSEYCPKETLRCIPECKHCFHADCVDEWLRKSNTCPVCRNSPSLAHDSAANIV